MHSIFNALAASAVVLVIFIYSQSFGGGIEGRYAPVVEGVVITKVQRVGDTRTRIWGSFRKARQCDFDRLEFFLGTPLASARVDLVFEEASKQRDEGWEDFGPWLVQLDTEQLAGRSFATVYHNCHPLWQTETAFHP